MTRGSFSLASVAMVWLCGCGTRAPEAPPHAPEAEAPWRTFEVVTRVEVPDPTGITRAWIPLPRSEETDHQRADAPTWEGNATTVEVRRDPGGAEFLYAEWPEGEPAPSLVVTSRVQTRDRAVDLDGPPSGGAPALSDADRQLYLSPSEMIPVDGIVLEYALDIAGAEVGDIAKARALYEWIVENTERDPEVEGCGTGDIANMLQTGTLSGKCVDLNALFVGMARSLGIPARHGYGVRVTESAKYQSLGKEGDITKGQHCRAEFWAEGVGWVPVDPADVRKLILEENGGMTLSDPLIQQARKELFGSVEMNWVVYNHTEDIQLPNSSVGTLPFLMYPQVQIGDVLCNCYMPETCSYSISSTEIL